MEKVIGDFINYHPWFAIAVMVIPWCWAVGYWIGLSIQALHSWIFKGLDEEKRFNSYTIKSARW